MTRHARLLSLNLMLLAACFAGTQSALAHAVLEKSTPTANAMVDLQKLDAGGFPIVLVFNSRIDAAHCSLSLLAQDGKPTTLAIDAKGGVNVLRSSAGTLKPGHYSLRWQVVASDGHITRGAIPFLAH